MGEGVGISGGYSPFEQIVIDKLEYLTTEQRNHHEFCIEVVQEQMAVMAAWNEPKE